MIITIIIIIIIIIRRIMIMIIRSFVWNKNQRQLVTINENNPP